MKDYKVISNGQEFDASEYQKEIFNVIENGTGNLIINACAGAAKTATIVNSIKYIPEKKKILFVAFNKDIVEKIKNSIDHKNATVSTFHSLGFSILKENKIISSSCENLELDHLDYLDIYKYNNYINNNIITTTRFKEIESLKNKKTTYLSNIKKMIDYSRYYLALSIKEISKVAEIYGIIPVRDELEVVRNVLLWGKENLSTIDYTDMIWLPNVLNLTTKKNLYDFIFVDEAQDTSIAEQKMAEKCFKRGTRFIAVGDKFQTINIWAGSSEKAIENFEKHPNTNKFKLPISYRCPKKIVELASKYSDNIIANDSAIDGEINYDVSVNDPKSGDMVLCRTTAPLIECLLKYFRNNKKAYMRGFENVRQELTDLIENSNSTLIDKNCLTSDGLFPKLYSFIYQRFEQVKNSYGITENEALTHQNIVSLYDNIEAIKVLSEGLTTTQELLEKINIIFNGDSKDAIQLSTVHKAKGLEADNVFILYSSLMPSPIAIKDWEKETENNLIYVAYTRAKKTLNFIKEDKYSHINGYFNISKMKKEILDNNNKVNDNKSFGLTEKNYNETTNRKIISLNNETKIEGSSVSIKQNNPIILKKETDKMKGGMRFKSLLK